MSDQPPAPRPEERPALRSEERPLPSPEERPAPGMLDLFVGFSSVSALAFGGVLPWAHHVIVDKRRWLTSEEFLDALALCQLLPGPNIANLAIAIGARFGGATGSLVSILGLLLLPVAVVLVLVSVYAQFATLPQVRGALAGMAAAAAGLIGATALRMADPMLRRRFLAVAPPIVLTFGAVALLRLPLWPVLLVLAPLSVAFGWRMR